MAKLFRTNGVVEVVSPKNGSKFTAKELQGLVGGWLEAVGVFNNSVFAICDEEGKLKNKPLNPLATIFARNLYMMEGLQFRDHLVGDVIFVSKDEID